VARQAKINLGNGVNAFTLEGNVNQDLQLTAGSGVDTINILSNARIMRDAQLKLGDGDNVFAADDVTGTVFVVREVSEVDRLMSDGVPEGTIAVIDDAGGTLTAPILPDFDAVVCLAGSVRSHLAIIAREFGVPTLMAARLTRPLETGERITVAYSAAAQSVEAYFGEDLVARAEIRPAAGDA